MLDRFRPLRGLSVAAAALAVTPASLAQNACIDAGVEAGCCEQVCAINPLCCDVAWDAKCEAILLSIGCICSGATPVKGESVAIDTTTATRDLDLTGFCDPGPFGTDSIHNYTVYAWTSALQPSYRFAFTKLIKAKVGAGRGT